SPSRQRGRAGGSLDGPCASELFIYACRCCQCSPQFPVGDQAVCELLTSLYRAAAPLVWQQIPDVTTAGGGEQSEVPLARLAPDHRQHLLWFGAVHPPRLVHASPSAPSPPCSVSGPGPPVQRPRPLQERPALFLCRLPGSITRKSP